MTAHQLLNSPWLLGDASSSKKRKSFKEQQNSHETENPEVLLTLKELLNVSSDWKEVNALKGQEDE